MRRLVALLGSVVLVAGLGSPVAAGYNVGQHIHVEVANHPVDGYPIPRAPWTFQVTIKLHNQTGPLTFLRVDDWYYGGNRQAFKKTVALGPCADCSISLPVTIDFGASPVGRQELRWHADVYPNSDGNRQFTSSRTQVCVVSCSPTYRTQPVLNGGASWYLGAYATVYDLSPDTAVKPGGQVKLKVSQDATRVCAFLNPDFHHGSSGTRLGCWTDTSIHTVTIPSTAAVGDRLVEFADQADGNAGLLRVLVGDGSERTVTDYEYQSWWTKGGVVLP